MQVQIIDKEILKTIRNKKTISINGEKFKIDDFNYNILEYYEENQKNEENYSIQLRKYDDDNYHLLYGQKIGNEKLYDGTIAYLIKK